MSFVKQIASNTLFQVIARVATSGVSFLITLFVARHLGVAGYGDFAKITAFVSLFYLLVDFGLNAVFLQREDAHKHFVELLYGRLLLALLCIVMLNALTLLLPYNPFSHVGFSSQVKFGIFLFSLTLFTEGVVYSASALFQKKLAYEYFMIASLVGSLVALVLVFLATFISYSLLTFVGCFVIGGIVKAGLALFFTREKMQRSWERMYVSSLVKETFPITLMLVFNLIYFRIDMLLLASMKSSTDVAVYDLAYKFFDFLIALPLFLSNALYPSLLADTRAGQSHKNLRKYLFVFFFISLLVGLPIWFATPLLSLIRPAFVLSSLPLRILLLSLPIFFVTSIAQWVLIAQKKQFFLAMVYLATALLNIVANIIFIPQFSYLASAIITDASEGLVLLALLWKLFL